MKWRLHDAGEDDDPLLSVINLVDVFLVLIAALLLAVARSPVNVFDAGQVTVIRDAGTPDMEIVVKNGKKIERFRGDGATASAGQGVKAGITYRMPDGSLVYVPE